MAIQPLALLQVQRPSWWVWTLVGLVMLAGLVLLIYFIVRLRRRDKEVEEEDWKASQSRLFGGGVGSVATGLGDRQGSAPALPDSLATVTEPESSPPQPSASLQAIPEPHQAEDEPEEVLGEEVWAQLESREEVSAASEGTSAASVAPPTSREPFEPPRVEPIIPRRQVFEPPMITPIVPTQTSPAAPESTTGAVRDRAAAGHPTTARLRQSGSVLGLPAEPSPEPLVLGAVAPRPAVTTLSNYGRPSDAEEKGHWATIALIAAILVVIGGVLSYLYVQPVQSWVHQVRDRVRGVNQQAAAPVQEAKPKVRLFPQRPEVVKNRVKVWGNVVNVSDATLVGLAVEVALVRSDGSSETLTVPVRPDQLLPGQGYASRGSFEFEYDNKKYTKHSILRVLSNGVEVEFPPISEPR